MLCDDLVGRTRSTWCPQSPVGRSNTLARRYPDDPTDHRHGVAAHATCLRRPFWRDLHGQLTPFYSDIGRLSIDPELMKGALPMQASFNQAEE
jgi:hypothetical protein